MYKTNTGTLHCIVYVGFFPWKCKLAGEKEELDHQESVFKGTAGLCRRTVCDGPRWCVPSSLHPTAPADHSANFAGRISPSRTLYIPLRRHVGANHPRQKARYSRHWQEPLTSFFFGRLPDEERGERRRRTRVTFPRPPRRRCPQRVPLPAGTSRFNTRLPGYSSP